EVGQADQPRRARERRVLGAARLRPGRVGRPVERGPRMSWVKRCSRTELTLHWVNAMGFFLLLATGLVLYLPRLSVLVGRRQPMKEMHFWGRLVSIAPRL